MGFLELQRTPSTGFLQTLRLDLKTKFCAQEWPKEGPSRPQTFPNEAQDRSKFNFLSTFGAICSHVKFVLIWYSFFRGILHFLKRSTPIKHCVGAVFLKISVFWENVKNHRKFFPEPSQNPPEIHAKSKKIEQKTKKIDKISHDDLRCATNAKKMRKNAKKWPKTSPKDVQ